MKFLCVFALLFLNAFATSVTNDLDLKVNGELSNDKLEIIQENGEQEQSVANIEEAVSPLLQVEQKTSVNVEENSFENVENEKSIGEVEETDKVEAEEESVGDVQETKELVEKEEPINESEVSEKTNEKEEKISEVEITEKSNEKEEPISEVLETKETDEKEEIISEVLKTEQVNNEEALAEIPSEEKEVSETVAEDTETQSETDIETNIEETVGAVNMLNNDMDFEGGSGKIAVYIISLLLGLFFTTQLAKFHFCTPTWSRKLELVDDLYDDLLSQVHDEI